MLTDLGRRVLGHLPVWAADEDAHVEAEGGPGLSERAYSLPGFTARMADDPTYDPPMSEGVVHDVLSELAQAGLCVEAEDGWRMTERGFEALHAPREDFAGTPGAALIDLHPAHADADAIGG